MRHQAIKSTALMLGVLLLAAGPAQAGPIAYKDVVSLATVFGSQNGHASVDLRLRSLSQQQGKTASQSPSTPTTTQDGKPGSGGTSVGGGTAGPGSNVPLTGTEVAPQQTQTTVETIQVGEVDGTICDCGPILRPGGGFPLWPLLGLAGVPLFFLPGDDFTPEDSFPTPTPTNVVPEPATLLLFGTGLLAAAGGARRRRRQSKLSSERGA